MEAETNNMEAKERDIKIAAKLYRDIAKGLFKDEYHDRIEPYKQLIAAVMKENNIGEFQAVILISQSKTYLENPMSQMLFMSAAVELIEPSKQ